MKLITSKLDYELYRNLFIKKDLEETKKLWDAICQNPVFLREAIRVQGKGNFLAPTICFMILKFPKDVDDVIYQNLAATIINSSSVVSSLRVGKTLIDFLALIMGNKDLKLNDYQKKLIIDGVVRNYGMEEDRVEVSYDELLDFESLTVARFKNDALDISVSEYEKEVFDKDEVLIVQKSKRYKQALDYRREILDNGNFDEVTKDMVAKRIEQDEQEFKSFIDYILGNIYYEFGVTVAVDELIGDSYEDLVLKFGQRQEVLTEIQFVKQLLDEHYQKANSLVRCVN